MAVCAESGANGVTLRQLGTGETCAGLVLLEPADVPPNPFSLTLEEGSLIAGAVAAVWVGAWCIKALSRALSTDGVRDSET